MLHEMGAPELARQYEWWTMKSQPNALKRLEAEDDPERGLVAVDFRAGMALLPFLPQCPADFKLIVKGIAARQPRPVRQGRRRRARSLCRRARRGVRRHGGRARRAQERRPGLQGFAPRYHSPPHQADHEAPALDGHPQGLGPGLGDPPHGRPGRGRPAGEEQVRGRSLSSPRPAAPPHSGPVLARIPGAVGRALAPLARPASRAVRPQALGPGRDPPPCRSSCVEGRLSRPGLQGACRRSPRRLAQVGAGERRARAGHRREAGALSPQPPARVPPGRRPPLPDRQGLLQGTAAHHVRQAVPALFQAGRAREVAQGHGRRGPQEPHAQRR